MAMEEMKDAQIEGFLDDPVNFLAATPEEERPALLDKLLQHGEANSVLHRVSMDPEGRKLLPEDMLQRMMEK